MMNIIRVQSPSAAAGRRADGTLAANLPAHPNPDESNALEIGSQVVTPNSGAKPDATRDAKAAPAGHHHGN